MKDFEILNLEQLLDIKGGHWEITGEPDPNETEEEREKRENDGIV